MSLIANKRKISRIFLGELSISSVFMGGQSLFPMCEKDMERRKEEFIDTDDVPRIELDESMEMFERNMLRKGSQKEQGEPYSIQFTQEQQESINRFAQELFTQGS